MCVCVCSSFPITSLSIHPASLTSFGKVPASASPGQPCRRSQPTPFTARASSKRDVSPFQGEQNRGQAGLAAGEKEGSQLFKSGTYLFYLFSFPRRGT